MHPACLHCCFPSEENPAARRPYRATMARERTATNPAGMILPLFMNL